MRKAGGLPRAIRTEECDHRGVGDRQRHATEHGGVAVAAHDGLQFEHQTDSIVSVERPASTSSDPRYAACTSSLDAHRGWGAVEQWSTEVHDVDVFTDLHHECHVVFDEEKYPSPRSATTCWSTSPNRSVSVGSRPDDGSSSKMTSNEPARLRASSTRRRSPEPSRAAWRCRSSATPVSAIASSTDSCTIRDHRDAR